MTRIYQISGFNRVEDISAAAAYYCNRFKGRHIKENYTPIDYIQRRWLDDRNVSLIVFDWEDYNLFSFSWSDKPIESSEFVDFKRLNI